MLELVTWIWARSRKIAFCHQTSSTIADWTGTADCWSPLVLLNYCGASLSLCLLCFMSLPVLSDLPPSARWWKLWPTPRPHTVCSLPQFKDDWLWEELTARRYCQVSEAYCAQTAQTLLNSSQELLQAILYCVHALLWLARVWLTSIFEMRLDLNHWHCYLVSSHYLAPS